MAHSFSTSAAWCVSFSMSRSMPWQPCATIKENDRPVKTQPLFLISVYDCNRALYLVTLICLWELFLPYKSHQKSLKIGLCKAIVSSLCEEKETRILFSMFSGRMGISTTSSKYVHILMFGMLPKKYPLTHPGQNTHTHTQNPPALLSLTFYV